MDFVNGKTKLLEHIKKYRYMILALLAGLLLLFLPTEETANELVQEEMIPEIKNLQEELSVHLSMVAGAGKVEVLLTENTGAETIYQTNEDRSTGEHGGDIHRDTVLVTDSDRREVGLVRRIDPPSYLGAIILCQGADDARVRLSLVEAVANATGLSSDKITVLKMN